MTKPKAQAFSPGIKLDVPNQDYRDWPAISQSDLKAIENCPAKWHYYQDHPKPPTDPMQLGSALHAYMLDPAAFIREVALAPDCNRKTKDGRAQWDAFCAVNKGKIIISQSDFETCKAMRAGLEANPLAVDLINAGKREVSYSWEDQETAIMCKARADIITPTAVVDLKTCQSAAPRDFARAMMQYGYHFQGAFYVDGWRQAAKADAVSDFILIAVEKEPPYVSQVYKVGGATMELGRRAYRSAITHYCQCLATGVWPGYFVGIADLCAPQWAYDAENEGSD